MPARLARATMRLRLPPSEWSTYQIHIPWRSNGVSPLVSVAGTAASPAPPGIAQAGVGMYARSDIARAVIAKITGRNPGAAEELVFTSTGNTVAAISLRAKKPSYHWRTETKHDGLGRLRIVDRRAREPS